MRPRPTRRPPPAERARLQVEAEERWARVAAVERGAQTALTAELDDVLGARATTEAQLTGGGRDALLALRAPPSALGVRQESAARLLAELQRELVEARRGARPDRRRPSSGAPQTTPTRAPAQPPATRRSRGARRHGARAARRAGAVARRARRAAAGGPRARRRRANGSRCSCSTSSRAASARSPPRSDGSRSAIVADEPARALELVVSAMTPASARCSCSSGATRAARRPAGRRARRAARLDRSPPSRPTASAGIPQRGELWFAGETAEAVLLELDARAASAARRRSSSWPAGAPTRPHAPRPPHARRAPQPVRARSRICATCRARGAGAPRAAGRRAPQDSMRP